MACIDNLVLPDYRYYVFSSVRTVSYPLEIVRQEFCIAQSQFKLVLKDTDIIDWYAV